MTSKVNKGSRKGSRKGARAKKVKQPHELKAEWAETGLMEIPVRRGNYYFKHYYIIPIGRRIRIAAAAAPYFQHKLARMSVSEAQAARAQRVMDEAQQMAMDRGGDSSQPQKQSKEHLLDAVRARIRASSEAPGGSQAN